MSGDAGEDGIVRPIFPWLVGTVERLWARPLAGAAVLDLGGARGLWLAAFLPRHPRLALLLDPDHDALRAASAGAAAADPAWRCLAGTAGALPLAAATLDVVVSRNSLHLWPDVPAALREICRVLRPGGCALLGRGFGPDLPDAL